MTPYRPMIKRIFAFALAVFLFFGMDGLAYAAADTTFTSAEENTVNTEVPDSEESTDSVENMEVSDIEESTENSDMESVPNPDDKSEPEIPEMSDTTDSTDDEPEVIPPSAPSAVTLTELTQKDYQTLILKWDTVPDASGYIIERKSSKDSTYTQIADLASNKNSYTDKSDILTGIKYTYRIYAYVTYLDVNQTEVPLRSLESNTLALKVTYTTTPASFKAASSRYDRIQLTWKKAAGASNYEIYRSTMEDKGFQLIATVKGSKTSYTDKKLQTGTTYYYKIRALRTCDEITKKAPFTAVKKARPIPQTAALTASYKNYSTATIKWEKISGANGYVLYRSSSKNGKYTKIATINKGSTISYTDSGLTTGQTYYYKIRAYRKVNNENVYGKYSAIASVKITLKSPTFSSITAEDYRTLTLNWKKVAGANGYYIYRSTSENGTYKKIATIKKGTTLSYTNSGLTTGKKYYYKIKAYRTVAGKKVASSASGIKSKATSLKKVTGITITPAHSNKLTLTWKKVTGAKSYNIYRSTTKNGTYKLVKKECTELSYTNSKLTNGQKYYYKITANRGSYENGMSAYVSAKAASLDLSQTSVVVQKRFSVTVTATASPNATVKWSTSNSKIATVSSTGVIKGVGVGSATIYAKANGITRSIKVKVRQTLDGIDVSKWQGTIDFKAVKKAGYDFVMIRIYNGYAEDPNFETYYKDAVAAGLSVGVYYYSYATSVDDAKADAQEVLNILDGRTLNYPVVIDMEDDKQLAGLTNQDRTDIAWAFCNAITAKGYTAGLYANTYWLEHYMENDQLAKMNLWIARWTKDPAIPHDYNGVGNIFMWQYTSDGEVPGISGRVDLDLGFSD